MVAVFVRLVRSSFQQVTKRIFRTSSFTMAAASTPHSPPPQHFYRKPLPHTCISFNSEEGKTIFRESLLLGHMETYFGQAAQFRTQDEPAYCGLSTLVMVLNTLEVDPQMVWKSPWRWYHENMLDCCVTLDEVAKSGITFDEFACLAVCNSLSVRMVRGDARASLDEFRETVRSVSKLTDQVIVVSYSRSALQQTGIGHFSPIGGYHPKRDLVLILDTARFKYPPYWVSLSLLFDAMKVIDEDTGCPRGYFVLSKATGPALLLFRLSQYMSISIADKIDYNIRARGFSEKWKTWLCAKNTSTSGKELLTKAVFALDDALKQLADEETVLSTQVDLKCPTTFSTEHVCAVRELIQAMADNDIYKSVVKLLSEDRTTRGLELAGAMAVDDISCKKCLGSDNTFDDSQCALVFVGKAHFVTMVLLSWAYERCDGSRGYDLLKMMQVSLLHAPLSFQNEVAHLRNQFNAILSYVGRCHSCSVTCSSPRRLMGVLSQ